MDLQSLKVAVVYDWIDRWGGVERVLLALSQLMPQAHYYTSVYNRQKAAWAGHLSITPSFMQRLPHFISDSRVLSALFYPFAFESFNFNGYDLVLSVSSSFAKSVITKPETAHLCYLLTPSRYLWLYAHPVEKIMPAFIFKRYESYMRLWDTQSAMRPDCILTISGTVAARCKKVYNRDSQVVYPPFDNRYWDNVPVKAPRDGLSEKEGFFLVVSRLEPYKRVDIAIDAFKDRKGAPLVVVGSGSQSAKLRKRAGTNIVFLDSVAEGELKWLYRHAKALIMPQEEDFGYVSLEAQYFGTPVITFGRGGACETVLPGKTGLLFHEQSAASLSSTLASFDKISYNFTHDTQSLGHLQAMKYSKDIFAAKMTEAITNSVLAKRAQK